MRFDPEREVPFYATHDQGHRARRDELEPLEPRTLWHPSFFDNHWLDQPQEPIPAFCDAVEDGDTITLFARQRLSTYSYVRVRLAGVDCPEIFHPRSPAELELGLKAKAFTEAAVMKKQIGIVPLSDSQNNGRYVAHVVYHDETGQRRDLGEQLKANHLLKSDVPA